MASVLTDVIPQPEFANADFIFHHEKVVAELKRIEIDNVGSTNNQTKLSAALDSFYREGKITTKEITEENWPQFPHELQNEIYQISSILLCRRHFCKCDMNICS